NKPTSSVDTVFPTPVPGTGPTITLTAGEAAQSLTFNDTYTLSGGDLTITSGLIQVAGGKTATIGSVLAGTAGLGKNGSGTLLISTSSTYSGSTNVNAGTLRAGATNVLAGSSTYTVAATAT